MKFLIDRLVGIYPSSLTARKWVEEKRKVFWQRRWLDKVMFFLLVAVLLYLPHSYMKNRRLSQDLVALTLELNTYKTQTEASLKESDKRIVELQGAMTSFISRPVPTVGSADVAREFGLIPIWLIKERSKSFAELYSYDNRGASTYGTAGYLGNGYFITVKHGVFALNQGSSQNPRKITSVKLIYKGKQLPAKIVDMGDALIEVDPGDWAILHVKHNFGQDLPPLPVNLSYSFEFADPIFRLGNDYSKGIIAASGYVGQKTPNDLVTCLTDGHPGVSGGGVLNQEGELVAIPIGRMEGDFRFSFMLPLRDEMFKKVSHYKELAHH